MFLLFSADWRSEILDADDHVFICSFSVDNYLIVLGRIFDCVGNKVG